MEKQIYKQNIKRRKNLCKMQEKKLQNEISTESGLNYFHVLACPPPRFFSAFTFFFLILYTQSGGGDIIRPLYKKQHNKKIQKIPFLWVSFYLGR